MPRPTHCARIALAALLTILTVAGCDSGPAVGSVRGTVYDGTEPLCSDDVYTWSVLFVGAGDQQAAGPVGKDGTYTVTNVPVGAMRVAVVGGRRGGMKVSGQKSAPLDPAYREREKRLERYKDVGTSGLALTVARGEQRHDIRLEP